MSRSRRLPTLLVVLAFAVAACGGDDGSDASSPDAPADVGTEEQDGTYGSRDADDDAAEDTVPDAEAEDAPAETGGADEGLGDTTVFVGDLSGETEVPGPGDPAATGRVEAQPHDDGRWCFDMVAEGLSGDVTDAHVHEAAAGAAGGVVVSIGRPTSTEGDVDTWTDVCVAVDVFVEERLLADPTSFYANVHTSDFGDGAVRGELTPATIFDLTLS